MRDDKLQIVEQLLLSSPPGQFQQLSSTLQGILEASADDADTTESCQTLNRELLQKIQNKYNSNTGRETLVLSEESQNQDGDSGTANGNDVDNNDFGKNLKRSLENYLQKHYSSKGVESNFLINASNDCSVYDIVLYAERIKLSQYHAGSWVARYTIVNDGNSTTKMDGVIKIHAHSFENGNVQIKSETELPSTTIENKTSLTEDIMAQIRKWDEECVLQPLHGVYDDMSTDILKKMRRVMPVTRTKFDWNVEGYRFVKAVGLDMKGKH